MVVHALALAVPVVGFAFVVRVWARWRSSNNLCMLSSMCKCIVSSQQWSDGEENRSQGVWARVIRMAVGQMDGGQAAIVQVCVRCKGAQRGKGRGLNEAGRHGIYWQARKFLVFGSTRHRRGSLRPSG